MNTKAVNAFLIRKDYIDPDNEESDDDTIQKYKSRGIPNLQPYENTLIKRIINNITYFLWKKAM